MSTCWVMSPARMGQGSGMGRRFPLLDILCTLIRYRVGGALRGP